MADERLEPGDLARLRAIAEEGRRRPLLGGRSLVVWGFAIAIAALADAAVRVRVLPLAPASIGLIWFAITGAAAVLSSLLRRRAAVPTGAPSVANKVERAVWQMAGSFLFTLGIGLTLSASFAPNGGWRAWRLLSVMPPVSFGVFAVALAATATAGDVPWLRRFAWASLGFTAASAWLVGNVWQLPLMALGALIVWAWPGLLMIRDEAG